MLQNPTGGDGLRCLYPPWSYVLSWNCDALGTQVPFQASLSPVKPRSPQCCSLVWQLIAWKIYVLWTMFNSLPFSPIRCSLVSVSQERVTTSTWFTFSVPFTTSFFMCMDHIPSYLSHLQNKCSPSSFSLSSSRSLSVSPIIFVAYLLTPSIPAVSFWDRLTRNEHTIPGKTTALIYVLAL